MSQKPEEPRVRGETTRKTPPDARTVKLKSDLHRVVARGTVFTLDGVAQVVLRIGDDGSTGDYSTIHFMAVGADGFPEGPQRWINPRSFESKMTSGEIQFIDGAQARMHTDLPPEWKARATTMAKAAAAARSAQIEAGRDALHEREPATHPSFGMIRLTRQSGGHGRLFGSPFEHHTQIAVEVYRATERRTLSNTRHAQEGVPLVSLHMSEAQFAQFITSVAVGEGTPCTLVDVWGQTMPPPPRNDEVREFHADVERTMTQATMRISEAVAKVEALLDKPSVTKADRKAVLDLLRDVMRAHEDHVPFTVGQFHERMEKIVAAGKLEIEAYIARRREAGALTSGETPLALTDGKE